MYQIEKYSPMQQLQPYHHQQIIPFIKYSQTPLFNNFHQQSIKVNNKIIRKKIIINNNQQKIEHKKSSSSNSSSTNTNTNTLTTTNTSNSIDYEKKQREKELANKRYKHNYEVFYYLQTGDIIEYSKYEEVWNENDRNWALYAGNGYVIRFDKLTCQIVSETYWNLANNNFMSHNIDFDRNYFILPIQLIINRINYVLKNNYIMRNYFSSDKNFVMWCRFDINKSDVEFSTNMNKCPPEASKYIMITRFLDCIEKHKDELSNDEFELEGKDENNDHDEKNIS